MYYHVISSYHCKHHSVSLLFSPKNNTSKSWCRNNSEKKHPSCPISSSRKKRRESLSSSVSATLLDQKPWTQSAFSGPKHGLQTTLRNINKNLPKNLAGKMRTEKPLQQVHHWKVFPILSLFTRILLRLLSTHCGKSSPGGQWGHSLGHNFPVFFDEISYL